MTQAIALHNGPLRFSAISEGEGPLVLCLHGFPDCNRSFRHQLPVLARAGFRGVSVSLRGYEPSSQPMDKDYSLASIASDVIAFLDQLDEEDFPNGLKVERIADAGHFPHQERPEAVNALLLDWIKEHNGETGATG